MFIIIGIQLLGLSGQRPENSQATGMALVRCILSKFLGVACHCFPPTWFVCGKKNSNVRSSCWWTRIAHRHSDSLWAGRSGDRITVGVRFSAPAQTEPGAHPPSSAMGTGSFPGVKRPGHGVDHPPPSIAEVKKGVMLYLHSPSGTSWPALG